MIEEGYQFLGITYLFTEDHKKMDKDPMRLVESIKSLCEEIPLEFILLSKKRPRKENERRANVHPQAASSNSRTPLTGLLPVRVAPLSSSPTQAGLKDWTW
jgi:hypothetical protein